MSVRRCVSVRAAMLAILWATCSQAQDSTSQQAGLEVGKQAMSTGVWFACGQWAGDSLERRTCPVAAQGTQPKIIVFVKNVGQKAELFRLAKAIDQEISQDLTLKWSFISVLDAKGAAKEEPLVRRMRLADWRSEAQNHGIEHLTIGLSQSPAEREVERFGIQPQADLIVAFVGRLPNPEKNGELDPVRTVYFVRPLKWDEVTDATVTTMLEEIRKIRRERPAMK